MGCKDAGNEGDIYIYRFLEIPAFSRLVGCLPGKIFSQTIIYFLEQNICYEINV